MTKLKLAIITPEANPTNSLSMLGFKLFLSKKTKKAPNAVPINGIIIPIKTVKLILMLTPPLYYFIL